MCNGGEGRTLKPCCDAALASSRYISNGPAKAHSLRCTGLPHPFYTLLFPSASESLFYRVLRVWPSSPPFSFFHSLFYSPALSSTRFHSRYLRTPQRQAVELARARARQRRRFLSSESSFHIPGSRVAVRRRRLGGRWNTRGPIQITELPSYPGSFFLSPSRSFSSLSPFLSVTLLPPS